MLRMLLTHIIFKTHIEIIMSTFCNFISLSFLAFIVTECGESIDETVFRKAKGRYFPNQVFKTRKTQDELDCASYCSTESMCASVNFKVFGKDKGLCEINSDKMKNENGGEYNVEFNYLEIIEKNCEHKTQFFSKETKRCTSYPSCNALLERDSSFRSGVYELQVPDSPEQYSVYCHMTEISGCGPGGWTLVMKIDGNKTEFNYNSSFWTSHETYEIENGLKGLTERQTKLASFSHTPFEKICLGMKVNQGETKWLLIDKKGSSLFKIFESEDYIPTAVGKGAWKSLVPGSTLQTYCNREGFNIKKKHRSNVYTYVRIGFIPNNEEDCDTSDSYIGYGTLFEGCDEKSQIACGNLAVCSEQSSYAQNSYIPAFGYILVQ